jgi:hypothetical protein
VSGSARFGKVRSDTIKSLPTIAWYRFKWTTVSRVSAILREIGIIGEAVNGLPEDVTAKRPEIAWRQTAAMRNFLVQNTSTSTRASSKTSSRQRSLDRRRRTVANP